MQGGHQFHIMAHLPELAALIMRGFQGLHHNGEKGGQEKNLILIVHQELSPCLIYIMVVEEEPEQRNAHALVVVKAKADPGVIG